MRLLVVEDEKRMAELLRKGLAEEGYVVTVALDGPTGLAMALTGSFELILLDIMLPGMDGFTIARRLRSDGIPTPILMITACDATPDVVRGLDSGANDYLTKPFSFEVLLVRIRALLRRGPAPLSAQLQIGRLRLDPSSHQVYRGDERIVLTRTELHLLEFLMRRPGQVVPRTTLIEAVWGYDRDIESNTLDASTLRRLFFILLDNSVKYTRAGGNIHVCVKSQFEKVIVDICDTGIGMSEQDLAHIFERYYRSDKSRSRDSGGAGLGLSLAKWIVDAHGGAIQVQSEPDRVSTFRVSLPKGLV
jgi:DNA-binding response OmpR family regulator